MRTTTEIFKEVLEELGFAGYKPTQMTNSDYWLCTCTAMERYAEQFKISSNPVLSEVLPLEGEIYPDTEADGIVFCGKCGKQK